MFPDFLVDLFEVVDNLFDVEDFLVDYLFDVVVDIFLQIVVCCCRVLLLIFFEVVVKFFVVDLSDVVVNIKRFFL